MKFIIYRESVAYSPPDNPPTTFKALTHQTASTGIEDYTEWTIQIADLAELQALANHERVLMPADGNIECGVRLEIKFPDKYGGVIRILDKDIHGYRGRK